MSTQSTKYLDKNMWFAYETFLREPIKADRIGKRSKCKQFERFSSICWRIFLISTIKRGVLAKCLFAGDYPPGLASQHGRKQIPWKFIWFYLAYPVIHLVNWLEKRIYFLSSRRCEKNIAAKFIGRWRNEESQARWRSLCDTSQLEPRACKWTWVVTNFRNGPIISRVNADELTLIIREIYCWKFHSVNHSKD